MWMYQFKLYFNRFCFWSQSFLQLQKIWRNEVTWYVNKSCPNCLYIHLHKIYCIKVNIHSIHIYSLKERLTNQYLILDIFVKRIYPLPFLLYNYINFTYWRILNACVKHSSTIFFVLTNCDICNTLFLLHVLLSICLYNAMSRMLLFITIHNEPLLIIALSQGFLFS